MEKDIIFRNGLFAKRAYW